MLPLIRLDRNSVFDTAVHKYDWKGYIKYSANWVCAAGNSTGKTGGRQGGWPVSFFAEDVCSNGDTTREEGLQK